MEYTMNDLLHWNEIIEAKAKEFGLDYYPQEFEICDFDDMIAYESYIGMPSHYPHWSFGKAFDRTKTLYQKNLTGLPYEMVINSNPCLAYLMKDNTLLLQILTIAHVYGHNDFFKNNRLFAIGTDASNTIEMFKLHADRIRGYIADPSIGYERVEKIINAAHALRYQRSRVVGEKQLTESQKRQRSIDQYQKEANPLHDHPHIMPKEKPILIPTFNEIPAEPTEDILGFIVDYAPLSDWEKDIINIIRQETAYFIPQIETKIMNEGWASYWHYNILNSINLDQGNHIEFIKRHNQVIRPHLGQVNPYFVGFKIFEYLDKHMGRDEIFKARLIHRDASFIRQYLNRELCEEMNLFEYAKVKTNILDKSKVYKVTKVSDEDGWKEVRDTLANQVGMSFVPDISVVLYSKISNKLYLNHEWTGSDLEIEYASESLKYLHDLWGSDIILETKLEDKNYRIVCKDRITSLEERH